MYDKEKKEKTNQHQEEKAEEEVKEEKEEEDEVEEEREVDKVAVKERSLGFVHGFVASVSVIIVSELGDKTFFIAAILAMKHSRYRSATLPSPSVLVISIEGMGELHTFIYIPHFFF